MAALAPDAHRAMGLTDFEFDRIKSLLGREPSPTELGMFAVMWSEHCAYKYSRPVLAYFKRYREAMENNSFENAGVVDIGDGLLATMKVESHNHPSAVEPYQGAATGVGGILRDIFTMGARPIASLNSLRFGPIREGEAPQEVVRRNRYLFEHVVDGIAGYGNCVGVPTVGGEVAFHPRYSGNPLVNAMAVGILKPGDLTTSAAAGSGNPVIYLGSATGKDGIHGATFASETLGEDSEEKRPNVQIGDPFAEKLLIEATLEALQTGAIVAIQDMGAAGLTCSTIEMSSKNGVGMEVDLDLVPKREDDMTGYELMLSESQERMLCVALKGREQEVIAVFRKWGLPAVVIGSVNDSGVVRICRWGEVVAELNARYLTDECPTYTLQADPPVYFAAAGEFETTAIPEADPKEALLRLLATPGLGSKQWVYRQYDQQVQTQTAVLPGHADAAVLAPRGTRRGISLTIDGNGRQVYFDPYVGGQLAVAEAARNVACTGAMPVAITDGLNFGNPQLPHVYWQFSEAVKGIADAANALGTPVISGNVSFYNESELGEVLPSPLIGMMGVIEDASKRITMALPRSSGKLAVLGYPLRTPRHDALGASAYLAEVHELEDGLPVAPDLKQELALCKILVQLADQGCIHAAHDVSEGGLALALVEMALVYEVGFEISLPRNHTLFQFSRRMDALWFGETPGRVVLAYDESKAQAIESLALAYGLNFAPVGEFDQAKSMATFEAGAGQSFEISLQTLEESFEAGLSMMALP